MMILEDRILLHLQDGRRDPGGETLVRTRHAQTLTDVRQLSDLFQSCGAT
jgi:hypothetical protein